MLVCARVRPSLVFLFQVQALRVAQFNARAQKQADAANAAAAKRDDEARTMRAILAALGGSEAERGAGFPLRRHAEVLAWSA